MEGNDKECLEHETVEVQSNGQEKEEKHIIAERHKEREENALMERHGAGDEDVPMDEHKMEWERSDSVVDEMKREVGETRNIENSEDVDSDSSNVSVDDSYSEQFSASENDEENIEAPLTDADIEELVTEFLEVESKASEAQEALEKESLAQVESDVRAELAESLQGDELEKAVSSEMKVFREEWEAVLDDLETQSVLLLEQLDGAGIELPSLYKWIESQTPNGCCTEAWKKRAHWVGSQVTSELNQSVRDAEEYLQSCRPVRRQHGRLLEEGASGFLTRKLSIEENRSNLTDNLGTDWSSFNELIPPHGCSEGKNLFGSKTWASVYLASTPQQAANMGLKLPGVDEVEEIGEVECNFSDPFYADAIANEKEISLSEEQKKNFRKVKEEDDENVAKKLQRRLKRQRQQTKKSQEVIQKDVLDGMTLLDESFQPVTEKPNSLENGVSSTDSSGCHAQNLKSDVHSLHKFKKESPKSNGGCKHTHDDEDLEVETKKCRTVIIEYDDELLVVENESGPDFPSKARKNQDVGVQAKKMVDIIDLDILASPSQKDFSVHAAEDSKRFHCTACSEALRVSEVCKHPLLEVIVCGNCKNLLEEKMQLKDSTCLKYYCGWCGRSVDLISCSSCMVLFCSKCITRNLGEDRLSESKAGWKCFCCSPVLLHQLISECKKVLGDLLVFSSESDSEFSDPEVDIPISKKRRKKRIRRILDDTELGEETKQKIALEKARQEHLKSLQVQTAGKSSCKNQGIFSGNSNEGAKVEMLGGAVDGYIVNVAREEDEDPVRIPPSISGKLKPHQVAGIRFMWENVVQSVKKVKSGDKGLGCILAHTMGLGKTFQVIAFLYTAMRRIDLGLRAALIVTPVNVLHNWKQEFEKWRPVELKPLRILMLDDVSRDRRGCLLAKWKTKGGVLLIGYAAFRNLSLGRHMKDRNIATEICHALQHGPDILVCDEAHMIKNTRADITHALKQVKTQRRIALTGSPLQNNLMEYYCMVDFVREGFLGSSHEFRNRFQNPIENGQHTNSTLDDVKIMNQRSHILYEQLKGFVQRMDMNVVKRDLPAKTVFVITVKLSPLQRKLYRKFLDVHGFAGDKFSSDRISRRSCFFAGYQALAQIWNHPGLLQMTKEHRDSLRREDSVENFLIDDGSSDDNMENSDLLNGEKQRAKNDLNPKKSDGIFNHEEIDWWADLVDEKIYRESNHSGKMVLLLDILSMSSDVGDKVLVFSQSLTTLDLIELYLSKLPQRGRENKFWKQGKDWYRLDGSTDGFERQKIVERFNAPTNSRVKCTLISTRAGSLGINLHAANRVIIFDGSWNPTNDLQAIYRVWRYGQNKPVYAYRLLAHGTMEEKIYKRQVTKEGLAARVVDRQQVHRTMSKEEILHLFDFGEDEFADGAEISRSLNEGSASEVGSSLKNKSLAYSDATSSADKFMDDLVSRHYPCWIANYHEHETLLQENEAERLSKEEQDMAWQTYQRSLEWEEVHRITFDDSVPSESKQVGNVSSSVPIASSAPPQTKGNSRTRPANQRKCSNLAHLLTLRSRGTKSGSSTVCGECSQEISWENLNRDGKSR